MDPLKRKAFTLVELLIVIVIIGILATLALPEYQKMTQRAKWNQAMVVLNAIRTAEMYYYQQYGKFVDGIPGASGDYATTAAELNAWLENSGIDVVEINEKAFEYFNYDVHVTGDYKGMAIRKDAAIPDPYYAPGRYGIAIDLLTGETEYNTAYYP